VAGCGHDDRKRVGTCSTNPGATSERIDWETIRPGVFTRFSESGPKPPADVSQRPFAMPQAFKAYLAQAIEMDGQ
jgi:hypothetical protein